MKNNVNAQYEICGVVAIRAWSVKVWVPAPLLILDSVSWAIEMIDQALMLATEAWNNGNLEEEREHLRVASVMRAWIENERQSLEEVPALTFRSSFKPRVVYTTALIEYFSEVLETSRVARSTDSPQFLIDITWAIPDTKFYATPQARLALRHVGSVPAEEINHSQLTSKLSEIRCPWEHW